MAGAFVDGALKGFNMMERHQSRQFNEQRLSDLDKRNEERYQQGQMRLADLDKQRKTERAEDVAFRNQQAKQNNQHQNATLRSMNDYRNKSLEQRAAETTWQQNYQTQQDTWKKDQPVISMAWQAFRDTGKIPEDLEPVMQRNKAMDPRTYAKPEARENIKMFDSFLGEVAKTGKVSELNSPKSIELTNAAFSDKLNSTIGQYNESVKSKVANNKIVRYVPLSDKGEPARFGFEIEVTYENGMKEIKPMTKGRTSEPDDPVMTYTPKELFGTVKARAMMADMMERPEYYDRLGKQLNANMGIGTRTSSRSKSPKDEYRKQLNSIQDEMTKALAKIEGGSDLDYLEDGGREQAINRVRDLYQQRIDQLNSSYGIDSNQHGEQENIANKSIDNLSDDELLKQLTSALGAQ
ncbi:hypothetical protein L1D46_05230 [Pseudoalteromonas sp. Isolate3]|uniref:hypothetical protein n=1 Tax=Pseudoalteromonas sp. Isolate3 TaxID=2908526 RepID=UPI001EFD6597|nr:hypothetical protein [Pseudoalteromonas sp. Isolate3]MCG9708202.1 hypothetical protein [Pseudoalteromonas sp. Isolate3]